MSNSASVTIQLSEFQAIQQACAEAKLEVAKLRDQLRDVKIGSSDQASIDVARAALEVVRYAVSSMPPESNRNWPGAALRVIAARLPLMPDVQQDDYELASTLGYFANEVDLYEKRRQGLANNQSQETD